VLVVVSAKENVENNTYAEKEIGLNHPILVQPLIERKSNEVILDYSSKIY